MLNKSLGQLALENGGIIKPLIIPSEYTNGTGLMNPSILIKDDKIIIILRHVNYTIYHSEKKIFLHEWGPLVYVHPENYQKLKTTNFYCELDFNYNIKRIDVVDTSTLDVEPLWEFVGLEDARIINWDNKLFLSGVRRDTTTNGEGRIELSEIEVNDLSVKEISRTRIDPPNRVNSYCEKNWMPIIDKPFHYVKWTNPTEIVYANLETKVAEQIYVGEYEFLNKDLRGGSQLISWKEYYIAITHEVSLWHDSMGRKNAVYTHRIVLWDKNFNRIKWSDEFSFLNGNIEFCAGLAFHNGNFLITFGFQDNAGYLLSVPEHIIEQIINL